MYTSCVFKCPMVVVNERNRNVFIMPNIYSMLPLLLLVNLVCTDLIHCVQDIM